ncbi:hypothetical protein IWX90DRAFT_81946 [Phyllosticta citrichinensis]|uniref:Uncharacterized protein n=1 Tax=Phyllosticta citrichinensis TaxID=1130410 RepID=A0ABR1XG07_9PEZI
MHFLVDSLHAPRVQPFRYPAYDRVKDSSCTYDTGSWTPRATGSITLLVFLASIIILHPAFCFVLESSSSSPPPPNKRHGHLRSLGTTQKTPSEGNQLLPCSSGHHSSSLSVSHSTTAFNCEFASPPRCIFSLVLHHTSLFGAHTTPRVRRVQKASGHLCALGFTR